MTEPLTPSGQDAAAEERQTGRRVLAVTRASEIEVRPVLWLWALRLALGTLALLGGREGIGKSIVSYTLAAMLTRGRLSGIYFGQPKSVIVAATEDSWSHTIVPRLLAAGADLDRVYRVDVTTSEGLDGTLSLPHDLAALEQVCTEVDAGLVLLDPLMSRLDASLDTHKDAEVRRALEPLTVLADRTRCCVLGLIHVNKSKSDDALTTLMGSRAFAAVARCVLFVMTDPDNEQARLLGQAKNNLGRTDLPTLSFRIVPCKVAETAEGAVWTGQLEWTGESDRSLRDVMQESAATAADRSATGEATTWLEDYLADATGPADWAEIRRKGQTAGHSKESLRRAKTKLGVVSVTSGFPRRAFWSLPASRRPVDESCGESSSNALTASTASTGPSVDALGAVDAVFGAPEKLASTGGDRDRF